MGKLQAKERRKYAFCSKICAFRARCIEKASQILYDKIR